MNSQTRAEQEQVVVDRYVAERRQTADEEADNVVKQWLDALNQSQPSNLRCITVKSWNDYEIVFTLKHVSAEKCRLLRQKLEDLGYSVERHEDNWNAYFHAYDEETRAHYERKYGIATLFKAEITHIARKVSITKHVTPDQQIYRDLAQLCKLLPEVDGVRSVVSNIQNTVEKIYDGAKIRRETMRVAENTLIVECVKTFVLVCCGIIWVYNVLS